MAQEGAQEDKPKGSEIEMAEKPVTETRLKGLFNVVAQTATIVVAILFWQEGRLASFATREGVVEANSSQDLLWEEKLKTLTERMDGNHRVLLSEISALRQEIESLRRES